MSLPTEPDDAPDEVKQELARYLGKVKIIYDFGGFGHHLTEFNYRTFDRADQIRAIAILRRYVRDEPR